MVYEVKCERCGRTICHLDYDPGPAVHYDCTQPKHDEYDEEET